MTTTKPTNESKAMVNQVRGTYLGEVEIGRQVFAVPVTEFKPRATVSAKQWFDNRTGKDDFEVGKTYNLAVELGRESLHGPSRFNAIAAEVAV